MRCTPVYEASERKRKTASEVWCKTTEAVGTIYDSLDP
jgi:hypothetical protein